MSIHVYKPFISCIPWWSTSRLIMKSFMSSQLDESLAVTTQKQYHGYKNYTQLVKPPIIQWTKVIILIGSHYSLTWRYKQGTHVLTEYFVVNCMLSLHLLHTGCPPSTLKGHACMHALATVGSGCQRVRLSLHGSSLDLSQTRKLLASACAVRCHELF